MRNYIKFALLIFLPGHALASDEIICDSENFKATLAVGSDGSVVSMVLSSVSGAHFSGILEVTNFSKSRRHVSIATKSVDVEALLGIYNTFTICLKNGKGYASFGDHRETMTCDWEI